MADIEISTFLRGPRKVEWVTPQIALMLAQETSAKLATHAKVEIRRKDSWVPPDTSRKPRQNHVF